MRLLFLIFSLFCYASIEDFYLKMEKKGCLSIRNIDYIYLINLDRRPEKLQDALTEITPYAIFPERFPAIYGWSLPYSTLNEIGVRYEPGMWPGIGTQQVLHFPEEGGQKFVSLDPSCFGKVYFYGSNKGPIGCTLSHLSVMKDAYESGYETIWILEDDFQVNQDPRTLSTLIDELDELVGKEGWDMLYTDSDRLITHSNDPLELQIPYLWRPDMPFIDLKPFTKCIDLNEHFMQIASRQYTTSIIYRRSGIKKILDFYREHHIFLPIDAELGFVPRIQTFILKNPVVTCKRGAISDTSYRWFSEPETKTVTVP